MIDTIEQECGGLTEVVHPRATLEPGTVQLIPIEDLHESPWNPRQHYPESAMNELVESMRVSGYREWLPLMVRPRKPADEDGDSRLSYGYEIGAGHRRSRAAREAGITHVPCVVRELSDEQFLDVLNFDNSGREDVHPLHEAAGWKVWMERTGGGVLDIAARIGQSKEYVYQRLKYAALIEPARNAFLDGNITARHAILIARLAPKQQRKALDFCAPPSWDPEKAASARTLEAWIRRNIHCSLDAVEFDLADADLFPLAGACTVCPHRLGNMEDFNAAEDLPDVCTQRDCYDAKENALQERRAAQQKLAMPAPAVVQPSKPAKAPASPKLSKEDRAKAKAEQEERERLEFEERERERLAAEVERQAQEAKIEAEKAARLRVLRAILANVTWPPKREEIAAILGDVDLPGELDELLTEYGFQTGDHGFVDPEKLSELKLAQLAVLVCVSNDFDTWAFNRGSEKLHAAAKRYGVDAKKVRNPEAPATAKGVIAKLGTLASASAKKAPAKKKAAVKKATAKKVAKKGGKR